jgi:hypothetical protein
LCFFGFMSLLCSCQHSNLVGHEGISQDISESKRRKVFIMEYESPTPMSFKIEEDTIIFEVGIMWLEKQWSYPQNLNETRIQDGYRLCINLVHESTLKNYVGSWRLANSSDDYFSLNGKRFISIEFTEKPKGTLQYLVYNNWSLKEIKKEFVVDTLKINIKPHK